MEAARKMMQSAKDSFEILYYKWNLAMQNHEKNGERNVYAEELLVYVLYGYVIFGVLIILFCFLVWLNVIDPKKFFKLKEDHSRIKSPDAKQKKKATKYFTRDMVSQHNKRGDCWLIIKGKVYDVSEYVDEHPGGDAILRNAGDDSTEGFLGPQHPGRVFDEVEEYFIGNLIEEKKIK